MAPLIGITPSPSSDEMGHGTFYRYCLSRTYVDAVRAAGGTPVILPIDSQDLASILPRLDGLLLSGGGDIDPTLYGDATVHPTTYGVDADRDHFEIEAFRWAVSHDLPTLCICRGIQAMAVAMGGTLVQDIASTIDGALEHRQQEIGRMRHDTSHEVAIVEGTPLYDLVGKRRLTTNSFHHQAVRDPGAALEVIATADDGVIEALWHPDMRFGLGVQWHPEMLAALYPDHAVIFSGFVTACGAPPSPR